MVSTSVATDLQGTHRNRTAINVVGRNPHTASHTLVGVAEREELTSFQSTRSRNVHLFRNERVDICVSLLNFCVAYRHLVKRTSEEQC
jgi:hypothetical protein